MVSFFIFPFIFFDVIEDLKDDKLKIGSSDTVFINLAVIYSKLNVDSAD